MTRTKSMYLAVDEPMPLEQDFTQLYQSQYRRIFNLCRYLLDSHDAAEDATQEVFLRAERALHSCDASRSPVAWLSAIASNHCVDLLRRRGTESRLFGSRSTETLEAQSGGPSPLGRVLSAERSEDVREAVTALPEKYRVPLVLTYYNGFSYQEVADLLGLGRNTVATLIFRGKQRLRQSLEGKGAKK